jgi:gas vesicle protein
VQSFQTPESLFGYYDASVNSSISPIVDHILNESGANVSANQLGYLGNAVAGYVQGEIASGKNLNDAFLSVAQQFGMNPQDAAAYAVNAVIDAAAKDTIYGVPVDEAAKQLAADPLGLFISNLGIQGVDTKALEIQAGLRPSDAQQALMDQIATLESGLTTQINTQGEQFQTLLNQYQEAGLSADQALQQTINDLSSNLGAQINTQSDQFQTLLNQYKEFGMTENEALRQTISDMQTGLTGQINTQSEQFQTLLDQYQQTGLTANEALQRTIADMQTGLTGQINTQGEQFQTLLNQYQELGMTANEALQQTIADMLSNQNVINNDLLSQIQAANQPVVTTPTVTPTTGSSSGTTVTAPTAAEINAQAAARADRQATEGSASIGETSTGGVVRDSSGNAVTDSEGNAIGYGDYYSSSDSDSGSSGGGGSSSSSRYCCSRMVHHGLWDVNHEFARLTVWSRKQPRWWRSGYPVWGKIVAKHLLGKVGFWTEVMQAFYDNKVRNKPRTWKSTLGELVIFPGAFVCGMIWREVPRGARLADPKEFA